MSVSSVFASNMNPSPFSEASRSYAAHTNKEKAKKCKQCNFSSDSSSNLRRHLKTHSGEKSNKCNQCDYASVDA